MQPTPNQIGAALRRVELAAHELAAAEHALYALTDRPALRVLSGGYNGRMAELTTEQTMVLQQVRRLGQISVRQIVGATAMDASDVEAALRELEAMNLVSDDDGIWRTVGE